MSETVQPAPAAVGGAPASASGAGTSGGLRSAGLLLLRQREAAVFVVVLLLIVYFGFVNQTGRTAFFSTVNLSVLSQTSAEIIIIALGEVLLLICGEIDLSAGFVYAFTPFIMYFLCTGAHLPGIIAILLALGFAALVGWVNGFLRVTLGLPSFVATLGTGFIIGGLILVTNNGEQATIPPQVVSIGRWMGNYAWSEIIWAVVLAVIFHFVLRRTRWGLHTIAVGGNSLAAAEAGVNVARIKVGNFMITSVLAGLTGLEVAFRTTVVDTFAGGAAYEPMLYAVAAAVIGGTAMLGGSGTMIGAFLGAGVLAVLQDGFAVVGVSAYPLKIFFGGAILISMIANVQLERLRSAGRIRQ